MRTHEIVPIDELSDWTRTLTRLASAPLEMCPEFPHIAQRFEAWWHHSLPDRPIFIAEANTNRARPITRRIDLLNDPAAWLAAKKQDLLQTRRVGDTLPNIRVDFGPVLLGALVGGKTEAASDTAWTHSFINDDWSNAPDWKIRQDLPWWNLLKHLLRMVAEDARGRYLVRTPDLGGSADVLLNLRGSSELCLDAIEHPEKLIAAQEAIYCSWHQAFGSLYENTVPLGAGVIHWLNLWSNRPYVIPACDFCYMIGPGEFQQTCLPDIARQATAVGRAVFHLDGPGATRHIDALLEIPEIQAIQFTPGSGTPSTRPWIEMFQKIQSKGRSLLVITPPGEVLELCGKLQPEGLGILLDAAMNPGELDDLFKGLCALYNCKA